MTARNSLRKYTTAFMALSLLAGSSASAAPKSIDPLVALSVFGTSESRAAVCAAGASAAAAAGSAVAAQAGAARPGCVLPVVDAAPPPAGTEAPPPMPAVAVAPVATAGSVFPLLLGLAAVVVAAVVLKHGSSNGEINLPISP